MYSSDDNYTLPLCCSIKSLIENKNKDEIIEIYVLYTEGRLSGTNRKWIKKVVNKKDCFIQFLPVDIENFKDCKIPDTRWSIEAFYRLSLPSILQDTDKVIYLDCDVTVLSNLSELYNTNIENYYAAMCKDWGVIHDKNMLPYLKKINLEHYYNSGVLLLNLKKIREDNMEEKLFETAKNYADIVKYIDQCIINIVFKNRIKTIDKSWNVQKAFFQGFVDFLEEDIKNIHYIGTPKPWDYKYLSKNKIYWFKYFNKLPFGLRFTKWYWPNKKYILKDFRKLFIWYCKTNKELIIFSFIKIPFKF